MRKLLKTTIPANMRCLFLAEPWCVTIISEGYFHVVLFIMLYKWFLRFRSHLYGLGYPRQLTYRSYDPPREGMGGGGGGVSRYFEISLF